MLHALYDSLVNNLPWLASFHMAHGNEWMIAFTNAVPRAKSRFSFLNDKE